jgi:DHA1 family bicyclomycin/chloramphenicol resistance-like MFS transporter
MLPSIEAALRSQPGAAQATLSTFLLSFSAGQLVFGPLSDRIGRRTALLLGFGVYLAGSIVCWAAPSMPMLLAGRAIQGLGGAAGPVISRAIVRDLSGATGTGRALSLLMSFTIIAPLIAPMLGGFLGTASGWRGTFALLTLLGAASLAMIFAYVPSGLPAARHRSSPLPIYRRLLVTPATLQSVLMGAIAHGGLFAYITSAPYIVVVEHGVPPHLFFTIFGIGVAFLAGAIHLNGRIAGRVSPEAIIGRLSLPYGLVAAGAAWLLFRGQMPAAGAAAVVAAYLFVTGFLIPSALFLLLRDNPSNAGAASALFGACQFAGGGLIAWFISELPGTPSTQLLCVVGLAAGSLCVLASVVGRAPR